MVTYQDGGVVTHGSWNASVPRFYNTVPIEGGTYTTNNTYTKIGSFQITASESQNVLFGAMMTGSIGRKRDTQESSYRAQVNINNNDFFFPDSDGWKVECRVNKTGGGSIFLPCVWSMESGQSVWFEIFGKMNVADDGSIFAIGSIQAVGVGLV